MAIFCNQQLAEGLPLLVLSGLPTPSAPQTLAHATSVISKSDAARPEPRAMKKALFARDAQTGLCSFEISGPCDSTQIEFVSAHGTKVTAEMGSASVRPEPLALLAPLLQNRRPNVIGSRLSVPEPCP
jgi:hypothetical protein